MLTHDDMKARHREVRGDQGEYLGHPQIGT